MTSLQTDPLNLHKSQVSSKGSMKRHSRERPPEATPIKKRIMASMSPKSKKTSGFLPKATSIKTERQDEGEMMEVHPVINSAHGLRYTHFPLLKNGGALDLSPGLRNTLAQFTLSSQCSLGGPATFSGHYGHAKVTPLQSLSSAAAGPLLVPPDSSTELTLCSLEGEPISCFSVGGEWRLCLPQVLNTVLRDFSLQQINTVCDQLYVYCSRCDAAQLHVLKVTGVLPAGAPSCGLITLTDAQRLCNALLHPGDTAAPPKQQQQPHQEEEGGEKEGKDTGGFWVEHQCLGKCQGLFVPRLYTAADAACIRCAQCRVLFSPKRFVMHSHRRPDKRTCHWGFDSARWACYLHLGRKHVGVPDELKYKQLLEKMKEKFPTVQQLQKKTEGAKAKADLDLDPVRVEPGETDTDGKAVPPPVFALDSQLYPHIKGNPSPSHLHIMQHSLLLYMQNKLNGLNPALIPEFGLAKEGGLLSVEMLRAILNPENKGHHLDEKSSTCKTTTELLPVGGPSAQSQQGCPDKELAESVSIETSACRKSVCGGGGRGRGVGEGGVNREEDDGGDSMVMEVLQLYNAQQHRLQTTLHKQRQLEKELEELRQGEVAEQQPSPQGRLEEAQTHGQTKQHATARQQKEEEMWQEEQWRPQSHLEPLSRHTSTYRANGGGELLHDSHYAAELLELRRRLDRAEEDREELQEELRREREAREKLERTIVELKQQIKTSSSPTTPELPLLTPPSNDPLTPRTP